MKTLYFNRLTLLGESRTPISLEAKVRDNFTLTKEVEELKECRQKENEDGEKIYQKEVFNTEEKEVIVGYDETIEVTDSPVIIEVQKVDDRGEKLYLEKIYDEEGVEVDTFESTKAFNENGEANEPIIEEVHKTSSSGKPLYLKPIIDIVEEKIFDHYEETTEVTEVPVMLPVMITVTKDVFRDLEAFSIEEVVQASMEDYIEGSTYDSIIFDMFLNESDLDLEKTQANTGVGILQLPPGGYATTQSIELTGKAKKFEFIQYDSIPKDISVYVNTKKVVDGVVELASPVSSIKIKFANTTDKYLDIKSYCVVYEEVVL